MKQLILIIALFFSINTFSQETTNYFFIRHAEKNRTDKANKNPNLTEKGNLRAIYWSEVFNSVKFDAVYSTNYNRTIQTAKPTAQKNNLEIQFYNPRDLYSADFQKQTKGKTVLIVGHSNTTPTFVNKVIGEEKYAQIDDSNNSNLYIVTISDKAISSFLLKIAHKKSH
jgi:broad specificity phosphatase PhoE